MKKIWKLARLLLVAGCVMAVGVLGAWAQTDLDPNSVGIYFDEGALGNTLSVTSPGEAVAYVIATRYEGPGAVDAWRGGVSCSVPVEASVRGGGENLFSNGPDMFLYFDVQCETPLPVASAIVLAELSVSVATEELIMFFLESSADGEGWVCSAAGTDTYLRASVPCINLPCYPAWVASINGDAPVPNETVSLDGIKSLYR